MSRCRCCDKVMAREENNTIAYRNPLTGVVIIDDLCSGCRSASFSMFEYTSDKEYQFGYLEYSNEPLTN